ncbi:MAG: chromate efflux transporter [Xanthobacteraceae bacterium]
MDAFVEKPVVESTGPSRLAESFLVWTRISLAGIGGAALQLATMHRLLVQQKRWISEERFFHAFSYCIALPGPETQQLAIYVGWLANRMVGGIIAGGLFILPGMICMMALSFGFVTGAELPVGQAIFLGIRPAILAIMIEAIVRFGHHVIHSRWMAALSLAAFVAAFLKLPFSMIVLVAALVGTGVALAGLPGFTRSDARSAGDANTDDSIVDLPNHAQPSVPHFVRAVTFWLVLWLTPPIALLAVFGVQNIFAQISLLFGKVAMMAIGGDYAVVAYAAQQGVDVYHWVSNHDMQAGVAMGEMVPGTIMIVTEFLGFIAAYRHPGALSPIVAGLLGGLLATWMTFCPCFLWISLIAPFIERLRRNSFLNNTLQAVTAAAVGMILNLSAWFGIRTFFHHVRHVNWAFGSFDSPAFGTFDFWALGLFICAAIAVFRLRVGAPATLAASCVVGLMLYMLGFTG